MRIGRVGLAGVASAGVWLVAGAGCSSTEVVGAVDVCFNAQGDSSDIRDADNFTGEAFGVRPVAEGESVAAPDGRDCSDLAAHVELVDGAGRHLWVGASARAGGDELVPADAFTGLTVGALQISSSVGFSRLQVLQLDNDDGTPVLALRDGGDVEAGVGTGSIAVAEGGARALPSLSTCGPSTTKSLDFRGDGDTLVSLPNGDSGALVVEGVDVVATNVWSADYDWASCEDVPVGFVSTWVLTRAP